MRIIYAELSRAGIRATPSRVAILTLFRENPFEHFSADQIYRRLTISTERFSVASLYRTLSHLLEAKLITSASLGDARVVYELNRGTPHYHLICRHCGSIRDVHDATLGDVCRSIAVEQQFTYAWASLVISGDCPDCRAIAGQNA